MPSLGLMAVESLPGLWPAHTLALAQPPWGSRTPSGSALAESPAGSGYPPMCWHCPDLPLWLFGMSLLLPGNLGMPNTLQAELDPGQAEPLAPMAAALARGSPDRC